MSSATATKPKTEIQSPTVNRGTDKATGQVFYVVKSDSREGIWYHVTFNQQALRWECDCPATKPCKHERAVAEVLKLRRQERKQEAEVRRQQELDAKFYYDLSTGYDSIPGLY